MEAKKVKPEPEACWEPPPPVPVEARKDMAEEKPLLPPPAESNSLTLILMEDPEKSKEKIVEESMDIDAELAWVSEQRLSLIKAWEESEKSKAQNNSQLILGNSFQDVQRIHANPKKGARSANMWSVKEDIALMSAWYFVTEELGCGDNQKKVVLWTRVFELYEEMRKENPGEIGVRNLDSLKGRKRRLDENAKKWIAAYQDAYKQKTVGMSMEDVKKEAHTIYHEKYGSKFCDLRVFEEVMSKHPKWELKLDWDSTFTRCEDDEDEESHEESRGNSKRLWNDEHGEFLIPETVAKDSSPIRRPVGRDAAKKKGKGKGVATQSSFVSDEFVAELRALRLSREKEVEVMKKLANDRIELESLKIKKKTENMNMMVRKMNMKLLNTLLTKGYLPPPEIELKNHLLALVFPK